jgi:hypothetical protein
MVRASLSLLGLVAVLLAPAPATAADIEVRDFVVWVDGKRGGEYHMTINRQDDGSVTMTGQADVLLSFFAGLKKYTYSYRGTEVWKDDKLVSLSSSSNDDGKEYTVTAMPEGGNLHLKVNGQDRMIRPDVWLTTYWHLPAGPQRNGAVPLLDADTGRELNGSLQYIGVNPLTISGQTQNYARYRLTGGVQVDLWYDGTDRLVRQEWIEDGHKSILELVRVRR